MFASLCVCVCVCARLCVCLFVLFIKVFIYLMFEYFLGFLPFSCYSFFISSFLVLVFICFLVRFSFSLFHSLSPCVVFLHIRSSTPCELLRPQNSGTSLSAIEPRALKYEYGPAMTHPLPALTLLIV